MPVLLSAGSNPSPVVALLARLQLFRFRSRRRSLTNLVHQLILRQSKEHQTFQGGHSELIDGLILWRVHSWATLCNSDHLNDIHETELKAFPLHYIIIIIIIIIIITQPRFRKSLKNFIHHSAHPVLTWPSDASILWLDADFPNMNLFSPAKSSSTDLRKKLCMAATLPFSAPLCPPYNPSSFS